VVDKRELIVAVLLTHRIGRGPGFCSGCGYQPSAEDRDAGVSATTLMLDHQADVLIERLGL
jgi:hypothetical protein